MACWYPEGIIQYLLEEWIYCTGWYSSDAYNPSAWLYRIKSVPNPLNFSIMKESLPSCLEMFLHSVFSFASYSLSQFPLPLQGAMDPLSSLNFWLPLCGVINGGGSGTYWGQYIEHPVCHRQIHPCASTGSLFSSTVIIYSSQSTLRHLLFILFALSIISLDLLNQDTGEKR